MTQDYAAAKGANVRLIRERYGWPLVEAPWVDSKRASIGVDPRSSTDIFSREGEPDFSAATPSKSVPEEETRHRSGEPSSVDENGAMRSLAGLKIFREGNQDFVAKATIPIRRSRLLPWAKRFAYRRLSRLRGRERSQDKAISMA